MIWLSKKIFGSRRNLDYNRLYHLLVITNYSKILLMLKITHKMH